MLTARQPSNVSYRRGRLSALQLLNEVMAAPVASGITGLLLQWQKGDEGTLADLDAAPGRRAESAIAREGRTANAPFRKACD
jgi:hypothetical protein